MSTREVDALNKQIAELTTKRDRLQRNAQPGVGSVVKFTRYLGRQTYTYAAIRTDAGWYVTGRDGARKYTWSELLDYAGSDDIVTQVGWQSITYPLLTAYRTASNDFDTVHPSDVW